MAKAKRNIGREVLEGIREIKRGEYGRVTTVPSVQNIREKTGLSQSQFARLLGVSLRTLQEWEQGRRIPSGAARTLLLLAEKNPRALLEVAQIAAETSRDRAVNTMSHAGYAARVEFDDRDNIFVGRILGIRTIVSFHGETVAELRARFKLAVEDYLADQEFVGFVCDKLLKLKT